MGPSYGITCISYGWVWGKLAPLALSLYAYFLNILQCIKILLPLKYVCLVQPNNTAHMHMNVSLKLLNSVDTTLEIYDKGRRIVFRRTRYYCITVASQKRPRVGQYLRCQYCALKACRTVQIHSTLTSWAVLPHPQAVKIPIIIGLGGRSFKYVLDLSRINWGIDGQSIVGPLS